ncbi:MAG: hypothetical protein U9P90_02165 [Patescibacteria group bacterium]|nr:hypothetical protein [Patescibacteria group bacterium]
MTRILNEGKTCFDCEFCEKPENYKLSIYCKHLKSKVYPGNHQYMRCQRSFLDAHVKNLTETKREFYLNADNYKVDAFGTKPNK